MAGFVVATDALPVLEAKWREELDRHGIRELHMKEFVPPHGRYSHLSNEQRRGLLEPLISLVHRRTMLGVGAAVVIDEFMQTTYRKQMLRYPELVGSPYSWCMRYCVAQVADWAESVGHRDLIEFVLDRGNTHRSEAERDFNARRADPSMRNSFRLGSIEFQDSAQVIALQCADLLAYELYKEGDRVLSESSREPRGSFVALLRDGDRLIKIAPEELIRAAFTPTKAMMAIVSLLPAQERFQVLCYGLRSITDEQRTALFGAMPEMRKIYELCLASGEMGKRLDELPPEVLPPDDPGILMPLIRESPGSDAEPGR